jgi:cytidylate kinase
MGSRGIVVAIDGPAGSGKSTTAKAVAQRLGYLYLDTGAMYRALGLAMRRAGGDPDDADVSLRMLEGIRIAFEPDEKGQRVLLNGDDVSTDIRDQNAANAASRVAVHPAVRAVMVKRQRGFGCRGGIVLEGRDTGTAVFPDAELKVFLSAEVSERARRRHRELVARGQEADLAHLEDQIRDRDARDRETQLRTGPWPATDAVEVDTTEMDIAGQVDAVVALVRSRQETTGDSR